MLKAAVTLVFGFLLTACAGTGPSYEKASREGDYGYHETRIAENRYRVTFVSRAGQQEVARDYALLRAAELTLQKGFDWFEVAERDTTVSERETTPDQIGAGTHTATTTTTCGLVACSTVSRPVGGAHVHTETGGARSKVTASLEFVMGKGDLPQGARYYQARDVADTIRNQRM